MTLVPNGLGAGIKWAVLWAIHGFSFVWLIKESISERKWVELWRKEKMEWTVPNLVFPITTAWVWMVAQMANIKCKPFESFMLRSSSSPSSGVGYNRDSMSSMVFHPGPSHSCSNPSDNESVTTIRRVAKVNIRRETTGSLMSLSGTISSLRKSQRFNEKKLYVTGSDVS